MRRFRATSLLLSGFGRKFAPALAKNGPNSSFQGQILTAWATAFLNPEDSGHFRHDLSSWLCICSFFLNIFEFFIVSGGFGSFLSISDGVSLWVICLFVAHVDPFSWRVSHTHYFAPKK